MSWSLTFNDLRQYGPDLPVLPEHITDYIGSAHPEYLNDLSRAYHLAKELDLGSVTLCGTRTPNPYGGDEVIDISVRGHINAPDFHGEMLRIITAGPTPDDAEAIRQQNAAAEITRLTEGWDDAAES